MYNFNHLYCFYITAKSRAIEPVDLLTPGRDWVGRCNAERFKPSLLEITVSSGVPTMKGQGTP